jgi:hypothetical protein
MSGFLGQIPEEVQELGADFEAKAGDVETLITAITTRLGATTWRGTDRDNFETSWTGEMTNNLNQLAQALRDTGTIANNNATQQITASS